MSDTSFTLKTLDSDEVFDCTLSGELNITKVENSIRSGTYIRIEHSTMDALQTITYKFGKAFRAAKRFSISFENVDATIYQNTNIDNFYAYMCMIYIQPNGEIREYFKIFQWAEKGEK